MQSIIKGFPNYIIDDTGLVYSVCHGKIRKVALFRKSNGYISVCLCKNNKKYTKYVHRLVAEAFVPNPDNKPCVNHINGIKNDNRSINLEWCTYVENMRHSVDVLGHRGPWVGKYGKYHPTSKIVLQIKNGKIIAEFFSTHEAERQTGIRCNNISECCSGRYKHAGGYQWKYKGE